ncbi:hypothetical protein LP415_14660 [Polaromonas sp. P1(28)-8]|nr:hypothetical protein LP415_14660 [Polaromonas sp. P1(28)-8]
MSADHPKYPGVPIDFPVGPIPSALAGVQPKVNLVEEDDQYYASGTSPSEVSEAFETCENLAQKFVAYCLEKEKAGFGTQAQILQRMQSSLLTKDWCTPAQYGWIVRRTAGLLNWQVPPGLNAGDP